MLSNLSLPWWAYALMGTGLCVFIALIAITVHRNRGMHRSLFASPYALWMMIFTIVPVILIAYYAFTDSSGAFTLDNFRSFWDSNYESNKIILDAMGEAGQPDERHGHRVAGHADRHRIQSSCRAVWDSVTLWKYHGQRSRPERFHQFLCRLRYLRYQRLQIRKIRDVCNQRIV